MEKAQSGLVGREDVAYPLAKVVTGLVAKYKLTQAMEHFLLWRLRYTTDSSCAQALGLNLNTVKRWKADSGSEWRSGVYRPDFKAAYEELMAANRTIAQDVMSQLMVRTTEVAGELLNATKEIMYKDPKSGEMVVKEAPDYENRYKGGVMVSNWAGEWGAKAPTVQNNTYNVMMDDFQALIEEKRRRLLAERSTIDDD
jgi:hypothetical protein